jgi:HD-GYP domain-containing protein (c-di-GMP phosphodiesterase class II)
VVSESSPPRRPVLTLDDLAQPLTRRPERLYALTAGQLAVAFSRGLDLGEGKEVGHAQRLCYIAGRLAEALREGLELDEERRDAVFFASLLHDAGVGAVAGDLFRAAGVDETAIFSQAPLQAHDEHRGGSHFSDRSAIDDAVRSHALAGSDVVRGLDLGEVAARAVEHHHERWDGGGYPDALREEEIPIEARLVSVADVAEVIISEETNVLVARRRLRETLLPYAATALDPVLVTKLLELSQSDEFWLGLYSESLGEDLLSSRATVEAKRSRRRVLRFAEAFAALADAKRGSGAAHAQRTAAFAQQLAEAAELEAGHAEMVRIAALLLDVGLLGVPARVMTKPDILSVTEMQLMRQHPSNSELVLEGLPGFEEMAYWIARHHERPDGKGYPEMLSGDDVPMESRVLAIADVYAALRSDRPHRGGLSEKDARQVLMNAAGTQLDAELVRTFVGSLTPEQQAS